MRTISIISRRFGGGANDAPATARSGLGILLRQPGSLAARFGGNDLNSLT
jgi:high-affinity K+ transport system ATPase subunit B